MSQSWKRRRSPAISCLDVCRVEASSTNSSPSTGRKQERRLCIPNNLQRAQPKAERGCTVTRQKEKNKREFLGSARVPRAGERVLAIANFRRASPFAAIIDRRDACRSHSQHGCATAKSRARCASKC